ncbi:MAG: crossover junction endodeoxyribonuclease RuvC [bacterium]
MRILGIDPGSHTMGWAVVESEQNKYKHIGSGVINTQGISDIARRLRLIFDEVTKIIDTYEPDALAIETVFFSKNQKSSFVLVQSATSAMLAAVNHGLSVNEYQPMMIKKALTGYGRADKEQVQFMVKKLLNINTRMIMDRSDAIAVALCHINSIQLKNRVLNHALSY